MRCFLTIFLFLEVIPIKKLIIAEKPNVMREFVHALDSHAKSICYAKPYVYYEILKIAAEELEFVSGKKS